jgi:hypothetical protein
MVKSDTRLLVFLLAAIFAFWLASSAIAFYFAKPPAFGDVFNALSALFSGLALAGIIFTVRQQKQELELQRNELILTRGEFESQNKTLKMQRFENTFFNLLSQHNQIIRESTFKEPGLIDMAVVTGHNAFRSAYGILIALSNNKIIEFMTSNGYPLPVNADKNELTKHQREAFVTSIIEPWHLKNPHNLYLYFLSLKRILKFIHRSKLLESTEERRFYASLLKDQLSYYEQPIILYFALLPISWIKGVSYYLKEYRLLDGIDDQSLITIFDKQIFEEFADKTEPAN